MAKLMVLGLLIDRPMHGYEINEFLKVSHADRWSDILPGSIYYALKTLNNDGDVRIKETENSGNRSKAIYEITDEGRETFIKLLKTSWNENFFSFPKKLYTLLAFIRHLPKKELNDLITLQLAKYEKELMYWDMGEGKYGDKQVDVMSEAVFLNGKKHLELDIELLTTLQKFIGDEDENKEE
jgi:DNA-binding PadR family transcriptional regulator